MSLFTESPVTLVSLGLLAVAMLGAFAFMLKNKRLVYFAVAAALLTVGLVALERSIISDGEAVRETIYQLGDMVQNNDVEGVLSNTSPELAAIRQRISNEMPTFDFELCNINKIDSFEVKRGDPKTAVVTFYAKASGSLVGQNIRQRSILRKVKLQLEQSADERWLITNYGHADPLTKEVNWSGGRGY